MLLNDDERRRFAAYLRQDAAANRAMAEQHEAQLRASMGPLFGPTYRQKYDDAAAEERVARLLESSESFTVDAARQEG